MELQVDIAGASCKGAERRTNMMPNPYARDRLAQIHRQDLLREAEHERRLSQLPQPKRDALSLPARFKVTWRALRMRLHRRFQQHTA
jgi:hypothetical protein